MPDFSTFQPATPTFDDVAQQYQQLHAQLDDASSAAQAIAAVAAWDALLRELYTWSAVVEIRYHQDTQNAAYQKAREYRDGLAPKLTDLAVAMKRRLMGSAQRDALEDHFGAHVFDLWKCDVASFDPVIEKDLVEQSRLMAEYTSLLAGARFEFLGASHTLSEMRKFAEHPDRAVRHDADELRWRWFAAQRERLDGIYSELVGIRHGMATKLGYDDYIRLGYLLMQRVDYDAADVERFRAEIREHVVPLTVKIRAQQAARLGVDPLMAWDEGLSDLDGNPQPQGDHDWMIDRATEMFADIGRGLDQFFDGMKQSRLMDLKSRNGKAGGGFCEGLPGFGMPFIFANFNGAKGDVEVFTHEMGHAFQNYSSRDLPLSDYLWPTSEACEIHSMGLEFLAWPQMDLFFGEEGERFRRLHLTESLLFLPYGTAVDHFQHLVYATPDCSADRRGEMWQEMEQTYLPTLRWGDLEHPASGRRWQAQLHIYTDPFYYIDYALALTCALQLWLLAEHDREAAWDAYMQLCRRGGEAPFGELVRDAGLTSPFAEGCLAEVVAHAAARLG